MATCPVATALGRVQLNSRAFPVPALGSCGALSSGPGALDLSRTVDFVGMQPQLRAPRGMGSRLEGLPL